jgi:hypothetical protein
MSQIAGKAHALKKYRSLNFLGTADSTGAPMRIWSQS